MIASTDTALSLTEAARLLPAEADRFVHPATITRWILKGLLTRAGQRVRLPARRIGGRWIINRADLDEFISRLSALPDGDCPAPRTPAQRQRASERAAAELAKVGI